MKRKGGGLMSLGERRDDQRVPNSTEEPSAGWLAREARRAKLRDVANSSLVAAALIVMVIVFSAASPYFFTSSNILRILQQVTVVAILAVGQAFVIITAGIDLSQGSVLALSAIYMALVYQGGWPFWLAVTLALVIGATVGLCNGILVTVFKMPPFIATLATLAIGSGAALLASSGQPIFGLPAGFTNFGNAGIGFLPYIVIVLIVLAIAAQSVLTVSRYGRYTYAIGSNIHAARVAGIKVKRQILSIYVFSGLCSAVGGIILTAYVAGALPNAGSNYELFSIAAVVIGGGSLFGGVGTVWGSMVGALLITTLNNGTDLLGVSTYFQSVLLGVVVLLAVYIDNFRRRPGTSVRAEPVQVKEPAVA